MYIAVIAMQDKTHFNLTLSTEHHGAPHRQTANYVVFCPRRGQKAP